MSNITLIAYLEVTAGDIIKEVLRILRVYRSGESIDDAEIIDNLTVLNGMIDSWNADNLMINAAKTENFPLTAGQSLYTIGLNANFNTICPESVDVESSFIRDSSNIDTPLKSMTRQEYNRISQKTGSGLNNTPGRMWYDPQYPVGRIQFDCPLSSDKTLYIVSLKPFKEFPGITSVVSFPPGYREALVNNLTIRLSPRYGRPVPPEVGVLAARSISKIQNRNARPIMGNLSGVPGSRISTNANPFFGSSS